MREIRLHGSEGGGAETNRSFLPLSETSRDGQEPKVAARRRLSRVAIS